MNKFFYYGLMLVSAGITAVSQISLKKSADKKHRSILFEYLNPRVVFAYVCYAAVLALNVFIYTKIDYRFSIVINSFSYILVMLLSRFLLGETLTRKRIFGNALIVLGIICFTLF